MNPTPDQSGAVPRRSTGLVVMCRALFVYLFLVWVMIRLVAGSEDGKVHLALVAGAVLIGFPITAGVARMLHRRLPSGMTGGWGVSLAAVATALVLPITCLQYAGGQQPVASTVSAGDHQIVPASLVEELTSSGEMGGLRLRIRGLSVAGSRPSPGVQASGPAMLLLDTSLRESRSGRRLLIEVRLVEEGGDRVLWREDYVADPDDVSALRRVLIRALTEGSTLR